MTSNGSDVVIVGGGICGCLARPLGCDIPSKPVKGEMLRFASPPPRYDISHNGNEKAIRSAKELVRQTTGIDPCYSAASAVAGLIEARGSGLVAGSDTVLMNLTGEDRRGTDFSALRWIDQDWIDGVELPDTGDHVAAAEEVLGA